VNLFNLFIPLILKGEAKKIIAITSGFADLDATNQVRVAVGGPYSISKAAMNLAVGKYSAEYASQGVLFMSVAPGSIDTGHVGPSKLN
jgi:NAD(P)-dependent dehydrogenase (short-subunit alcohol dehydrogenase family)